MSSDDEGYVHDPAAFDDEGSELATETDETAEEFGWRGWTLVAVLLLAIVVAPLLIVYRPPSLPYRVALLVLPLIPALLLGATAVWATTR